MWAEVSSHLTQYPFVELWDGRVRNLSFLAAGCHFRSSQLLVKSQPEIDLWVCLQLPVGLIKFQEKSSRNRDLKLRSNFPVVWSYQPFILEFCCEGKSSFHFKEVDSSTSVFTMTYLACALWALSYLIELMESVSECFGWLLSRLTWGL